MESKQNDNERLAPAGGSAAGRLRNEVAITEAKDSPLARDITTVCDALEECEFALAQLLRTDKIGWLQEIAYKNAAKAMGKPPNDEVSDRAERGSLH